MSEKRRGLGRGLGALIPAAPPRPPGDRPVDVFFPEKDDPAAANGQSFTGNNGTPASDPAAGTPATGTPAAGTPAAAAAASPQEPKSAPAAAGPELLPVPGARFAEIPVGAIRPNPRQPRQHFDEEALTELVHSIREVGILQPVVVRALPGDGEPSYELIMGERRWRATQEAGFSTIPAIVRDTSDDNLLRDALLENLHRSELNPLEEGRDVEPVTTGQGRPFQQPAGCRPGPSRSDSEQWVQRAARPQPRPSLTIRT